MQLCSISKAELSNNKDDSKQIQWMMNLKILNKMLHSRIMRTIRKFAHTYELTRNNFELQLI